MTIEAKFKHPESNSQIESGLAAILLTVTCSSHFDIPGKMTKRKSRAAMSGISGFVCSMNTQHTQSNTVQVADVENGSTSLTEPPPKRQVDDDTSDIERAAGDHPGQWIKKYDATGLAPHYTSVDQVPEHLQKCTTIVSQSQVAQQYSFRLLATISVFFFVFNAPWLSSG